MGHHKSFIFKLRRTPYQENFSRLATICELITLLKREHRVHTEEVKLTGLLRLSFTLWFNERRIRHFDLN